MCAGENAQPSDVEVQKPSLQANVVFALDEGVDPRDVLDTLVATDLKVVSFNFGPSYGGLY